MIPLRLSLAALLLALSACGEDEAAAPTEPTPPPSRTVEVPAPVPTSPESVAGTWMGESGDVRVTLILEKEGPFRHTTVRKTTGEVRTAAGTWAISGQRLTLHYQMLGDQPADESVVYRYAGGKIVMKGQGEIRDIVLVRQNVLYVR